MGALAISGGKVVVRDRVPCISCCDITPFEPCEEGSCASCWQPTPVNRYEITFSGQAGAFVSCNAVAGTWSIGSCLRVVDRQAFLNCSFSGAGIIQPTCEIGSAGNSVVRVGPVASIVRVCDESGLWLWQISVSIQVLAGGFPCCTMNLVTDVLTTESCYPHLISFPPLSIFSISPPSCGLTLTNPGTIELVPLGVPA